MLKWKSPSIQIGNKEMAQFSVGEATLSTEVNTFTTGKNVSGDITSQIMLPYDLACHRWINRHLMGKLAKHTIVSTGSIVIYPVGRVIHPLSKWSASS